MAFHTYIGTKVFAAQKEDFRQGEKIISVIWEANELFVLRIGYLVG